MKNGKLNRILALVVATVLMLGAVVYTAAALGTEPGVIYNGTSRQIEFERVWPFASNSAPDLFPDLKRMMPGDSVTQIIRIGARNLGQDRVRILLRAENPNADYVKLMETYGHWVEFSVMNGETEVTGNLSDGILLGSFSGSGSANVDVTLTIAPEAGNELQDLMAEVDWVFTAEVIPTILPPIFPIVPDKPVDENDLPWLTADHINYIIGYDDGLVHPDWSVTRAEVATIFYRLLTADAREAMWNTERVYPDVSEEQWFYIAVSTLTNGGLLEGYPDGTFKPGQAITRAELATIICRFDQKFGQLETTAAFDDTKGHWAEEYINFAVGRGYVIGFPDGTFRPDEPINRASMVTMVNRLLRRAVDDEGLTQELINWPDNPAGTWFYHEFIEAANYHAYTRSDREVEEQTYTYEEWTELLPTIDWKRHETEWIRVYAK